MFDYYECQAVIVVNIVSVQSFQLASARKPFEAGLDGWLSAVSGVGLRLWSETEITTSSSIIILLCIISLLLFSYIWCV